MFATIKIMLLFFESFNNNQKFLIKNFVMYYCRNYFIKEVGYQKLLA